MKTFMDQLGFDTRNIFVAHNNNQAMVIIGLGKFNLINSNKNLKYSTGVKLLKETVKPNKKIKPFKIKPLKTLYGHITIAFQCSRQKL